MSDSSAPAFVRKGLLRLSWPLLLVTVLTLLATLGNVVLLSISSPELNAAVAMSNQILGIMYDVSVLFSIGALVIIAQLLGAGRLAAAQRSSVIALRAASILGLVIAAVILAFAPLLLQLVNTPAEIFDDALAYLWIVAFGLTFNAYIVTASAVLRAYGRTPALLVLGIIVNILDVTLLAFFLLVMELGAVGAALPTLLVRGVGVLVLAWMIRSRTGARFFGALPETGEPRRTGAWSMARLSIPTVIENGAYNLVIVATVSFIGLIGTDAINARSYALTLTALVTGVILALAQGNKTIVGWDVGGDARAHARRLTLRTAAWTAAASAALALVLWYFADAALSVFGVNATVLEWAREALLISAVLLPLSAISQVLFGALRSAGDVVVPMAMSLFASIAVLLPVSWLFIPQWGDGGRRHLLGAGDRRSGEGRAAAGASSGRALAPAGGGGRAGAGAAVTRVPGAPVTTGRALFSHVEDLARLAIVHTPPRHRTPREIAFSRYLRRVRRILRADPEDFEVIERRMLASGPTSAIAEVTLRTAALVEPGDMLHVLWENAPARVERALPRLAAGTHWSTPLPHRPARRVRYERAELDAHLASGALAALVLARSPERVTDALSDGMQIPVRGWIYVSGNEHMGRDVDALLVERLGPVRLRVLADELRYIVST